MNTHLLRLFIREQIASSDLLGATGFQKSSNTDSYTFEDFQDYDIDIVGNVNGEHSLTITFKGKKLGHSMSYQDYDEAYHQARMIIDKHRVEASI